MKKKVSFISITLILLSLLFIKESGKIQNQVGMIGQQGRNTYNIIHIKILKGGKNFRFFDGSEHFNLSENSIYGGSNNGSAYIADDKIGLRIDINLDNEPELINMGRSKLFYQSSYVSYLGLFDKVGANEINYDMRPICINIKELKKIYPPQENMFTDKEAITYGLLQSAMYDYRSKKHQISSVKINRNWKGQPIKLSIATIDKPNKYIGIYTLTYDNNILAYRLGFNKTLKNIKNTPMLPKG